MFGVGGITVYQLVMNNFQSLIREYHSVLELTVELLLGIRFIKYII